MHNQKRNDTINTVTTLLITTTISLILAFPTMEIIKHAPGVKFKTEMDYIATWLLVSALWFLAILACARVIKFYVNSKVFYSCEV